MKTGIYALYWEEQDLVYIGQSIHIEKRWEEHKKCLQKANHTNYKVQKAYNLYGYPNFVVLEECGISELNDLEIYWTKEYDSTNSLNIIEAGNSGYGYNASNSKYSKLQILLVFRSLYLSKYEPRNVSAKRISVNVGLFKAISNGETHLWLKEKYPFLYKQMCINKGTKKQESLIYAGSFGKLTSSKKEVIVISPDNKEYTVLNKSKFARDHGLSQSGIQDLISKRRKSHKGWTLKT